MPSHKYLPNIFNPHVASTPCAATNIFVLYLTDVAFAVVAMDDVILLAHVSPLLSVCLHPAASSNPICDARNTDEIINCFPLSSHDVVITAFTVTPIRITNTG